MRPELLLNQRTVSRPATMAAAGRPPPTVLSSAVVAAAESGAADTTLELFDREGYASIDTRSLYQSTLLHVAAKHGHVELARRLLARGADVNTLDFGGMRRSPLHWACKGGHVAMVELLMAAGADTKVRSVSEASLLAGLAVGTLACRPLPLHAAAALALAPCLDTDLPHACLLCTWPVCRVCAMHHQIPAQ